ncbi:SNF2 family N-terminal domain-containing protein [Ephemerocybe angulata]|uniref:SNF2 family N-terminal domain-containing protein n=1 Tax=Ephemerocybe angulata TaxID=980116 RepID=A0A8H6IDZ3_9AGAR|nr:SNF2 family N-terminal domain-containing protein [Tulosesus angulatus]
MKSPCQACCDLCRLESPKPSSSSSAEAQGPYALTHLLKAGTLTIQHHGAYCEHQHASDGWHAFSSAAAFLPLRSMTHVDLCKQLEFLAKHKFIAVTYTVMEGCRLVFRVYLMPYDLAGAGGALRLRQESVLAPARKYLRGILRSVRKGGRSWEGEEDGETTTGIIPDTPDARSLAEIYSDLASPNAIPVPGLGDISARLLDYEDTLEGLGLHSKLYKYQRRSVAAMLHRELGTQSIPDPLYVPATAVDGTEFFLQPGTMEILLERPQVAPCHGGILCEELGTGKTVMVLSLILATLRQLPKPEESLFDDRPIMTPLSFRYFPSQACATARARLSCKGKARAECRVPSLVELLLDRSRTAPIEAVPNLTTEQGRIRESMLEEMEENFENLPLAELRRTTTPFYFHYPGDPTNNDRDRRNRGSSAPKRMYLSPATIIVVPPNLLKQWDMEIMKHCEYPVRVLILREKSDMPSVNVLAMEYDIVLMTYTRFTAEAKGNATKLHSTKPCQCPEFNGTSIPDCNCFVRDVSPLLQIRWKRLVIDEGHVSSSLSTDLIPCTKALSIERRWIVTGTPTTNLLGLALGQRTFEDVSDPLEASASPEDSALMEGVEEGAGHDTFLHAGTTNTFPTPQVSANSSLSSTIDDPAVTSSSLRSTPSITDSTPPPNAYPPPTPTPRTRIWDHDDRADLRKLGNMISHFIAVPQFAADAKLMATHVTEALLDPLGPRPGAIQVLNQVMEMVMVRHRVEDIEDDVKLPPLAHESVLLDLHPLAIKTYNAFQAGIALNAIDSERTDKDYLFHPSNAEHLQVTVKNMSQIMFWSVDENRHFVDEIHRNAKKHMETALKRNRPPEDIQLLEDALRHAEIAVKDTRWNLIHAHEDVPYQVYSIPSNIYDAWTRIPGISEGTNGFIGFLSADRLLKLHDLVLEKPLTTTNAMIDLGRRVAQEDIELRQAYLASQSKKASKSSRKGVLRRGSEEKDGVFKIQNEQPDVAHSQIASSAVKKASAKETMDAVKAELKSSMARIEAEGLEEDESNKQSPATKKGKGKGKAAVGPKIKLSSKCSILAHNSALAHVRVGSSASNKLNYIIDQVLKYSDKEKFLIFTDSELTLAHIAEAMELIHVKHLRFSGQIPARDREQLVLTFETSETYRVFLMELKHGARGLLSSVSIVSGKPNPSPSRRWQSAGTAEENMVIRRQALQQSSHEKLPKLIEEAGMRHFISHPKFIEAEPTLVNVDFPLLDLPPVDLSKSVSIKVKRPPSATPSPKKRKVWLMDPMSGQDVHPPPSELTLKKPRTIRFVT